MKTVAALIVLLGCVAFSRQDEAENEEFMKKFQSYREQCIKDTGVNDDLIKQALQQGNFADDKNLKCYFKCIFQKLGRMDDAGNVDLSDIENHIPPEADQAKAKAALAKCKNLKLSDPCEVAFQVAKCMREAYGAIKSGN